MKTEQNPITGREELGDIKTPVQALVQFYYAFNRRDLKTMSQNWLQSPESEMDNPLGGIKRGWAEIEPVYRSIFEGTARVEVEFYDYTIHETPEFFYAVGRERGTLRLPTGEALSLAIRTSRIFRRVNGVWKQVHHHGSIDDPKLLERYQAAVLKKPNA